MFRKSRTPSQETNAPEPDVPVPSTMLNTASLEPILSNLVVYGLRARFEDLHGNTRELEAGEGLLFAGSGIYIVPSRSSVESEAAASKARELELQRTSTLGEIVDEDARIASIEKELAAKHAEAERRKQELRQRIGVTQ